MTILITGGTGGIGSSILQHLSTILPPSSTSTSPSIIGLCRNPSKIPSHLKSAKIPFRTADYSNPTSLLTAFTGIKKLLLISSDTFDTPLRVQQHQNVITAAKAAGVEWIYYTSLAFGGTTDVSKTGVMEAHLITEKLLRESGLTYTIIREGIYANAFPFFLNWYPATTQIKLPFDGRIAWTSREELAEGTAKLMLTDTHRNDIALLTAQEALTLSETVAVISKALGKEISCDVVSEEEYQKAFVESGKPEWLAGVWCTTYKGLSQGEGEATDPLLEELLGRKPTTGTDFITKTLKEDPEYRWHQNEAKA